MKTYFCLVGMLFVFALVQCENATDWSNQLEGCRKEFELPEDLLVSPDFANRKIQCFSACFLKQGDRLTEGKLSVDHEVALALKYFPDKAADSLKDMTTDCANKANEEKDDCAVAGTLFKCFTEKFGPLPSKVEN